MSSNQVLPPPAYAMDVIANAGSEGILIAAHRGAWLIEPENSVPALEACVEMGVAVMEIDVQLTADRQLIVNHDATIDRMSNGTGLVADHTLAQLKSFRLYERDGAPCDIWKRRLLTDIQFATLAEIFEAARGKILINLEIKSGEKFGFVETFAAARQLALDMNIEQHVLWKIPAATRTYELDLLPGFRGDVSAERSASTIVDGIDTTGLSSLAPIVWQSQRGFEAQIGDFANHTNTPVFEVVAQDRDYWPLDANGKLAGADDHCYMGIAVLPRWCAGLSDEIALRDPDAAWGKLADMGCRIIMTDRPEQMVKYLKKRGKLAMPA
ncbi:glycerophosphodiester phosphodiesterase family protein [Pelagibacterium sp.]|uniref:glycerophosphodiester phosphodiesterase family protein n=1 Tax=Pelagibacterium sp. TaxID=1967288 RepID=UPI003A8FCCE7